MMDQVRFAAGLASPKSVGYEPGRTTGSVCSAVVKARMQLQKRNVGRLQIFGKMKGFAIIEGPLPVDQQTYKAQPEVVEGTVVGDLTAPFSNYFHLHCLQAPPQSRLMRCPELEDWPGHLCHSGFVAV